MSSFKQTLSEIKLNMHYDLSRKAPKNYAKLKSIARFNRNSKFSTDKDIHGLLWEERVILEVGTIDLDSRKCEVTNPINKLSWITSLDKLTFCNADGSRISFLQ